MFTTEERESIRSRLLAFAREDERITGGAITGSFAAGNEDQWSDIDLAFGVREDTDLKEVLRDFSDLMHREFGVVDELDIPSGSWIYRVFLLANTLQVDVAVAPESDFGARAPTFQLVFGKSRELAQISTPKAEQLVGWAWLYALHVRSSMERGKLWQAEYMLSAMRDKVLELSCLRHGLPTREGRGIDLLPIDVITSLTGSLVRWISFEEIILAFRTVCEAYIEEVHYVNSELATKLEEALKDMTPELRDAVRTGDSRGTQ